MTYQPSTDRSPSNLMQSSKPSNGKPGADPARRLYEITCGACRPQDATAWQMGLIIPGKYCDRCGAQATLKGWYWLMAAVDPKGATA